MNPTEEMSASINQEIRVVLRTLPLHRELHLEKYFNKKLQEITYGPTLFDFIVKLLKIRITKLKSRAYLRVTTLRSTYR